MLNKVNLITKTTSHIRQYKLLCNEAILNKANTITKTASNIRQNKLKAKNRAPFLQWGYPKQSEWKGEDNQKTIKIIKNFNGCAVRIENSVTMVTVRHHDACRVMPNIYPEWRNLQFNPSSHYRFFFLHTLLSTIAFRLEYVGFFLSIYAKITTFFSIKKCSVRLLSYTLTSKRLRKLTWKWRQDVKITSKRKNHHTDVMHESRLTPLT